MSSTYRTHVACAVGFVAATMAGVLTAYLVAADAGLRQNMTAFTAFLVVYGMLRFLLRMSRQRVIIDLCAMLTAYVLFVFVGSTAPDGRAGWAPFSYSITALQFGFYHIRALKSVRTAIDNERAQT